MDRYDRYEVRIVQTQNKDGNRLPIKREYTVIVDGKKSARQLMDFLFENSIEMIAKKVGD